MDGFERFAQGQLITVFSATNYCGKSHFCIDARAEILASRVMLNLNLIF